MGGKVGPAHDGNCAYVMQQEAARKAHQEKYDKWSIENAQADEKFNELMRKERKGGQTKPCPKCKQAITKNHGCDHMTSPCAGLLIRTPGALAARKHLSVLKSGKANAVMGEPSLSGS